MLNIQNTQITLENLGKGYGHVKFDDGEEKLEVLIFPGKVVVIGNSNVGEWIFNDAYELHGDGSLDAWYYALKAASYLGCRISAKRLDQATLQAAVQEHFEHWLAYHSDFNADSPELIGKLASIAEAANESNAWDAIYEVQEKLKGSNFVDLFSDEFPLEYTDKFKLVVSAVNHAFKLLSESDSGVAA